MSLFQDWKTDEVDLIDFKFENEFRRKIIGVDEAGRGPWAGPVVAAACFFPKPNNKLIDHKIIKDSKKLSRKKRVGAFKHLLLLKKRACYKV